MNKVLYSDISRLKKSKIFLGCIISVSLYCIYACVNQYITLKRFDTTSSLDSYLFCSMMLSGLLVSIFCSLFVGTEYSDGVIRNKIVVGQSRKGIYFSHFITCFLTATILFLVGLIVTFVIGSFLFDKMQMSFFQFIIIGIDCIILNMAYASLFNLVSMSIPNKAYASIINILLFFFLIFTAFVLYQSLKQPEMIQQAELLSSGEMQLYTTKNPSYLTGVKREIYQFFLDFLPGGQTAQILNLEVAHPYKFAIYSILITIVCNGLGFFLFYKKDIK